MITFTRRLIRILAFTTTAVLSLLYLNQQSIWYAVPVAVLGILWYRLGAVNMAAFHVGFLSISLLLALDVLENGIGLWAIITIHSALAQWDLLTLINRLQFIEITRELDSIIKHHLFRLGYVIIIGVILSFATVYLQTNIPLIGIMICGIVAMFALSRTIKRLRRDTA